MSELLHKSGVAQCIPPYFFKRKNPKMLDFFFSAWYNSISARNFSRRGEFVTILT